jgi:hypothetical protein
VVGESSSTTIAGAGAGEPPAAIIGPPGFTSVSVPTIPVATPPVDVAPVVPGAPGVAVAPSRESLDEAATTLATAAVAATTTTSATTMTRVCCMSILLSRRSYKVFAERDEYGRSQVRADRRARAAVRVPACACRRAHTLQLTPRRRLP